MSITEKRLAEWLPPPNKTDEECTLLELWSKYCHDISKRFQNPKDTIADYTTALSLIQDALNSTPASLMNTYDCWNAVKSTKTYMTPAGYRKEYETASYEKRMTAIHTIFNYCEARAICTDPLWLSPWELLYKDKPNWKKDSAEISDEIEQRALEVSPQKVCALSREAERKLVEQAISNLTGDFSVRDGRWIGLLCYLYMGLRPAEGRGLRYRDLCTFDTHPNDWYCNISHSSDADGSIKAHAKNRNAVRRLPVHPELAAILKIWSTSIRETISNIDDLPIICVGTNYETPCKEIPLAGFIKKKLTETLSEEELTDIVLAAYATSNDDSDDHTETPPAESYEEKLTETPSEEELSDAASIASGTLGNDPDHHVKKPKLTAKRDLSTRILRRNFITKLYSETLLDDNAIRAIVGHQQTINDPQKYSLDQVHNWLTGMKHRMIMPSLRNDWYTDVRTRNEQYQFSGGYHEITVDPAILRNGGCIDISLVGLEEGGDLSLEILNSLPEGSTVTFEKLYYPPNYHVPHRVVSDYDHWNLDFIALQK